MHLHQADGTAWMGLYCSVMLQIALELAHHRSKAYEDIASKFFEHYIAVIDAINSVGGTGVVGRRRGILFRSVGARRRAQHVAESAIYGWYRPALCCVHYEAQHRGGLEGFR